MATGIEEFLYKVFQELDIPAYYITRRNNNAPCLVYQFIESPKANSDDIEEITEYEVFLILYAGEDIVTQKRKLQNVLQKYGFRKKVIPKPVYYDDLLYFEQPMQYSIFLDAVNFIEEGEKENGD